MKFLIWFFCFFVFVVLQVIIKNMGFVIGGLPMIILWSMFYCLGKGLCHAWDVRCERRKVSEYTADNSPNSDYINKNKNSKLKQSFVILCCVIVLLCITYGIRKSSANSSSSINPIPGTEFVTYPITETANVATADIDQISTQQKTGNTAPDSLSSDYKASFSRTYPDDVLQMLHKSEGSDTEYGIYVRVIERTYGKFYQRGYQAGWSDFYTNQIGSSYADSDLSVYSSIPKDVGYADGYRAAVEYLTKDSAY